MKKIIITGCLATLSFLAIGQTGPYVSFNTGVAFAAAGDALGQENVTQDNGDFTNTNIYGSFGNGLNLTLRGGFKMTQNFGAEMGVSYLYGFRNTIDEQNAPASEGYTKTRSTQVRLMPGIVMETSNEALTVYSRMGLVLPLGGKTKAEDYNLVTSPSETETIIKNETTGAFSVGYYGGLGISLKIGDNLKFFGEVEMINLRIKQKSSVITEYTVGDNDVLSTLSTQQKETEYVDEIGSGDNTNNDEPRKRLASTSNFSSLGLNFGIRMNF